MKSFIITALFLLGLITTFLFLPIGTVQCQIEGEEPCPENLVQGVQAQLDAKKLLLTHYEKSLQQISYPGYVFHSHYIELPDAVTVTYIPEEIAYILVGSGDSQALVTQSGAPLPTTVQHSETKLVTVVADSVEVTLEKTSIPTLLHQTTMKTLSALEQSGLQLETLVWQSPDSVVLQFPQKPPVIIDSETPADRTAALPALFVAPEYQELQNQIQEIDLRFRLPVLRTGG